MAPQPPPYGSQEYWNQRFSSNTDTFEWLETPDTLERYISDALSTSQDEDPQVLHVGCGTSSLWFCMGGDGESCWGLYTVYKSQG
ncbi:predicted protein [Plenodomus lingam JN3]|uniref:Predicted protein n=1 Tax=Leptosphaeria maculans (strain JN3 / isolate v23.1.3 / race Av1-4-5-6-7-8) TaxID=985895 RepID=E5AD26_LEPMJ|nr:predicted protein [Plenodomus lingam JN3]CBY02378.1 predicted protein [Plenodomus lingam JN3]